MKNNVKINKAKQNSQNTEKDQAIASKNNLFFEMIIEGLNKLDSGEWEHYLKENLDFVPKNAFSKKAYTRFNRFSLFLDMVINQYKQPFYATFNQISKAGGKLKKGSKSAVIQYFNFDIKHKESKKRITLFEYNLLSNNEKDKYTLKSFLKHFRVFNVSLIENISDLNFDLLIEDETLEEQNFSDIENAENLISKLVNEKGLNLKFSLSTVAYYSPSLDYVNMPEKKFFKDDVKYYSTLFHELIHWTGNPKRLNRFEVGTSPKRETYAFEELVAEMGAMLIYFDYELTEEFKNSLIYLKGWVKATSKNEEQTEILNLAFSDSKKAVHFIYN